MQLEMIRTWKKNVQVGIGHDFVVLGAHVKVFTPINGCHSKANFAWTTMMFMSNFLLCSNQAFNIAFKHIMVSRELFAHVWLEIWDSLHTPNARWLAYCGLHVLA